MATIKELRKQLAEASEQETPSDAPAPVSSGQTGTVGARCAQSLSDARQAKCLAHVLRSISEVDQPKRGRRRIFGKPPNRLLREALEAITNNSNPRGEQVCICHTVSA